jgi:hypothetical protein
VYGEPGFRDWVRHRGPISPNFDSSPLGRILAGERLFALPTCLVKRVTGPPRVSEL